MENITVNLSTVEREELNRRAAELGLAPEELFRRSLRQVLSPTKLEFTEALAHTMHKNADLYRRLA
jgi:hypothetical protein